MNVVYFCSDFFAEICGVSIESLFDNNIDTDNITCYVVENGITDKNRQRLQNVASRHDRNIVFIPMPSQEEVFPDVRMNLGNAYARMAIGEILPVELDRVLLLDCDTLILDSLKKMYDCKFEENEYVAGVYDCVGAAYQRKVLMAPDDMKYCNAGMFLVDLRKWRNFNVKEQLLKAFGDGDGTKLFFLEQDLMNRVFYGHIKVLHLRYNMITSLDYFDFDEVIYMKHPTRFYSKDTYYEARKKPAIIHGATCFYIQKRMWVAGSDHPRASLYMEYRNRTDWKDVPMIEDQRTTGKKLYAKFWHLMPRECAIRLVAFLMQNIRPMYAKMSAIFDLSTVAKRSAT